MLNKRLLKRYSFLVLLVFLPLLALAFHFVGKQDSGVLSVAVYGEDASSKEMIEALLEEDSVVRFSLAPSEEKAMEELRMGKLDSLWIFPKDMPARMADAADGGGKLVKVVEAEDSVLLRLSREKLYAVLFPALSEAIYKQFMQEEFAAEAKSYYERVQITGSLVEFAFLEGEDYAAAQEKNPSYLLSPLRGLMAVWLLLCGFAANLYFIQDKEGGLFAGFSYTSRKYLPFLYQFAILLQLTALFALALVLAGLWTEGSREIPALLLFVAASIGFCNLCRLLFRKISVLACVIPICLILFVALSPIFADVGIRSLQYGNPVYYYLNLVHSRHLLYPYLLYIGVLYAAGFVLE